jgi:hypothetical protein
MSINPTIHPYYWVNQSINLVTVAAICMGLREIRIYCKKCISRIVIVALSAQPPGVNKLCVCSSDC